MLVASLIISVYKNIEALHLILLSAIRQSYSNFEIIIAEDNDSKDMKDFIAQFKRNSPLPIKHISQKDEGFMKNKALNKAIAISESEYIIFIDGDCIMHKHFIKMHIKHKEKDKILFGRRVLLSEKLTNELYETQNIRLLTLRNLIASKSNYVETALFLPFLPSKISNSLGICGSNWSIHKKDLLEVNGFDEDYYLPGYGEDTDIELRLFKKNMHLKKLKNKAIQYHLHHKLNYTDSIEMGNLLEAKIQEGLMYCKNGIDKYLCKN